MGYAILVDWSEDYERWENEGRKMIEEACTHKDEKQFDNNIRYKGYCDECGFTEDSAEPMMNYAYPLETTPDSERILEVLQRTNLTVMYNTEEDAHYLALTGGGMDLSQDIALAYKICENIIPFDLCLRVNTQNGLSQSGKNFDEMAKAVIENLKNNITQANFKIEDLKKSLKKNRVDKK